MRCGHCKRNGVDVEHVRGCAAREDSRGQRGTSDALSEQYAQHREHALAGAGLVAAPDDKVAAADRLRLNQTAAERKLGQGLLRLSGSNWDAQVNLHGYIVDFYCYEAMLALEADGAAHDGRRAADGLRDDALRAQGIEVMRIANRRIHNELNEVLREVNSAVRRRGKRGRYTPSVDAAWTLYRYGAEALGLVECPSDNTGQTALAPASRPQSCQSAPARRQKSEMATCDSCKIARASVDPSTGLCGSCTIRHSKAAALRRADAKRPSVARPFICCGCRREFRTAAVEVVCRSCRSSENVRPKCLDCGRAVDAVIETTRICERCSEVRSVALSAAGTGETPTGRLSDRRSRARRVR